MSVLLAGVLGACSYIAEDERLLFVSTVEDALQQDTATIARRVLVEDFTGQACVNCPAATTLLLEQQELYGEERVIVVGIYSGYFGKNPTTGANYPLTTDEGNYYYDLWGVEVQPSALINRRGVNSVTATWATAIYNEIMLTAPLELALEAQESAEGLTITLTADAQEAVDGVLQLWLTEDGLVSTQYLADGSRDTAYVHNHVFRASVTPLDGDPLTLASGESLTLTYTSSLDSSWAVDKLSVVAIVSDASGVLQAQRYSK